MDESSRSNMNTLSVPTSGDPSPAILGSAPSKPMRIVVNNVGGAPLILSHDATNLTTQPALAGTFQLLVGQNATFVLAPGQSLFAVGSGTGGVASVATSVALSNKAWGS